MEVPNDWILGFGAWAGKMLTSSFHACRMKQKLVIQLVMIDGYYVLMNYSYQLEIMVNDVGEGLTELKEVVGTIMVCYY